jgi:hypothetical protein
MEEQKLSIDLANATDDDLQIIKSAVLKRLAERAKDPASRLRAGYDRHGSGHSRS